MRLRTSSRGDRHRSMRLGVIGGLFAILVVLGAGCGGTETAGSGAAGIVPAGVPAFVAVDADPDSSQWDTVNELASKFPDKQKGIDSIKKDLRDEGLDWDRDVKPALGSELDIVWLDFANGGENIVALMQPDDDDAFARAVKKGNAKDSTDKLLYEKFRGWTLMSNKQTLIERFKSMSDAADEALDEDPTFTKAMKSTPDEALAKAYVDGRKVMDEVRRQTGPDEQKFVRQLGSLDWLAASVAASSDGVAVDTTVHGTLGTLFNKGPAPKPFDAKLPSRTPKNAVFYLTFHGTKGLLAGLQNNPTLSGPELAPVMEVLGEIGTLLQGEDALYVRPSSSGGIPEVTLVAEPRPGVSGRATLDRIINRFHADLGVRPRHGTVAGTPTSTLGFGDFAVRYADVGGKLVVTDLPAGIAGIKNPGTPLADSATYKDALQTSGMPSKTHGFLYVDIRAGTGLVEKLSGERLPGEVTRNLKPLRSAVEYAVSHQHQLSVRFFLRVN
jgi:Protein of unknown function (DUF3352)